MLNIICSFISYCSALYLHRNNKFTGYGIQPKHCNYSMKNIPIPSEKLYRTTLIEKVDDKNIQSKFMH